MSKTSDEGVKGLAQKKGVVLVDDTFAGIQLITWRKVARVALVISVIAGLAALALGVGTPSR